MSYLFNEATYQSLVSRAGHYHVNLRLGIENERQARIFGQGRGFFHLENWDSAHSLIKLALRLSLLHNRGKKNALDIQVVNNTLSITGLPAAFDGYRILHLSDLHLDISDNFTHALAETVRQENYDLCVMTGDYRARTYGEIDSTLKHLCALRTHLGEQVIAILGNHDSLHMLLPMEKAGIVVLLNENLVLNKDSNSLYLVGIDDPHYFRTDNLEKAMQGIPENATTILLSHSPEMYKHAAHAGINALLCGHTHGGQICLPGGIPVICNAAAPRSLCSGNWRYEKLKGYTSRGAGSSIVDVRLNCPPEITIHTLRRAPPDQPDV